MRNITSYLLLIINILFYRVSDQIDEVFGMDTNWNICIDDTDITRCGFNEVFIDSEEMDLSEFEDDGGTEKFVQAGERLFFKSKNDGSSENESQSFEVVKSDCYWKCEENCGQFVRSLSSADSEALISIFKGPTNEINKNLILRHLNKQTHFGCGTHNYVFKGHKFCIKFLSKYTKVSEYILKIVLKDFSNGRERYIHGSDSKPRGTFAAVKFTAWLKNFSELYGQSAPDELTTVLPAWLTKATLYKLYLQECTPPFVKKSTFYKLFKENFGPNRKDMSLPHIRISKWSTHSVCSQCVAFANFKKSCKTQMEVEFCKALQFQHKQLYGLARRRICELQQLAITYPDEHLFISVDGMDNRKSDLPKFLQNVKNLGNFQKLPSHITGAIVTSGYYAEKEKNFFFVNHNQFEQGSNMVITVIYHILHSFLQDHHRFPKHLHLNTDNCGRENKNRFVFSFLSSLVQLGVFSSITMDFLLVGHTGIKTQYK